MKTRKRARSTKPRSKGRMPRSKGRMPRSKGTKPSSKGRRATRKRKGLRGGGKKYVQEVNKLVKRNNMVIDGPLYKEIELIGIENLMESKLFDSDETDNIKVCYDILNENNQNNVWRELEETEEFVHYGGANKQEHNNLIQNGVKMEIKKITDKPFEKNTPIGFTDTDEIDFKAIDLLKEQIKPECNNIAVWGIEKLLYSSHIKPKVKEKIMAYRTKIEAKTILNLNTLII